MPDLARRRFLAGLGAATAAPGAHRIAVGPRRQRSPAPFGWGVASFDPTTDGVVLWTRVVEGPAMVRWVLASDEALTDVVESGTVLVTPEGDHCARVDVRGLPAGRTWWYGFTAPDETPSPVGRTRTLPEDAERLRIGVASCSRFATAGFAAYRALAERDVDLVLHLGDYIYEDGTTGVRAHDPAQRLTQVAHYRARYAQHRLDPDLQALHAKHPMVAVWDDHDVSGNAWRDGAPGHDDGRDGPWLDRLVAAGQAHEEWLPGRTGRGPDGRLKAWRALDLGGLAELVLLDTRTWGRDRQPASEEELADGSGRTMLGADQADFAIERLTREDAPPWVLLGNQVMYHPLQVPAFGELLMTAARAGGFLVADGLAVNPDQWDGYSEERERINVQGMRSRGGVVVLSGDVHSSWAWEGPANAGDEGPVMVELVAPAISSDPFSTRFGLPANLLTAGVRSLDTDLAYVELESNGYLLVDLTPERVLGEWWYVDPADAGTQRFGAARAAPIEVPMRLSPQAEPSADRTSGSATTAPPAGSQAPGAEGASDDDEDGPPWPLVAGGAAAAAAAVGALVAVRRRTDHRGPS
ncbi:MAG: alkaline phosphatase D family protein [Acidimicrobiales bacterium]|nr:alkaline phosphatase D family protein [Acidimicrobiales bacterium]